MKNTTISVTMKTKNELKEMKKHKAYDKIIKELIKKQIKLEKKGKVNKTK